ncbi:MAG TPA: hypothetical protein VE177_03440, partial [Candidatus Binatus sp.]|nr:hypothetical protein [Candidatus Binatus sp.]
MDSFSPRQLLPIYGLGVFGALLQIAGAQWDVSAHILGIVETFFTPAHSVLYAGIGLVGLANLQGVRVRLAHASDYSQYSQLFTGLRVALLGTILQLVAAPIDFYWHSTKGFDPYLFTPPHSLLILGVLLGGTGMTIGVIRLLQAQRLGQEITNRPRLLSGLVVTGIVAMWGQFNFAGYWITDLRGMAYTFGVCGQSQFWPQALPSCLFVDEYAFLANLVSFVIFAAVGTFFYWTTKKLFHQPGVFGLTTLFLGLIYAGLALGFLAYGLLYLNPPGSFYFPKPTTGAGLGLASIVIPVYLSLLVPIVLLDLVVRRWIHSRNLILFSGLVGPLTAFADGRYTLGIIASAPQSLLYFPIPT